MKILLLNGSPRAKGNTSTALNHMAESIRANAAEADIELVNVTELELSGCTDCEACKQNGGTCVIDDDSAEIIQKVYDADVVILGTPVYYWGITAQIKMVVDKFYSKNDQFSQQKKQFGIVAVGEAELDDPEYGLIFKQFECICDYLGWDLIFSKPVCAFETGDLAKDDAVLEELAAVVKKL